MIIETIITSLNEDKSINNAPFGIKINKDIITISPYIPSITHENLKSRMTATVNYTNNANLFVDCLLKKKIDLEKCHEINCFYIKESLKHQEIKVIDYTKNSIRPEFKCKVIKEENHHSFNGINRANNALIEACILATRINLLKKKDILDELKYLSKAVNKTSGKNEIESWEKLNAFIISKLKKIK